MASAHGWAAVEWTRAVSSVSPDAAGTALNGIATLPPGSTGPGSTATPRTGSPSTTVSSVIRMSSSVVK